MFITVDPARDAPDHLQTYWGYFHKDIVGLTGGEKDLAQVAGLYRALFRRADEGSAAGYLVAHNSYVYLLNKEGKVVYVLHYDVGKKMLLEGSSPWKSDGFV